MVKPALAFLAVARMRVAMRKAALVIRTHVVESMPEGDDLGHVHHRAVAAELLHG
jgi:hypothetical protein